MEPNTRKRTPHESEEEGRVRHLMFDADNARAEVERRYSGKYEYEGMPAIERGVYHEAARYYAVLNDSLRDLDFTEGEACLLVDVLHSFVPTEVSYRHIDISVADAIRLDGVATKWNVDAEALIRKLTELSPGHRMAIIDAVERFNDLSNVQDLRQQVRVVGLARG
jgi:hypothetical protein